MAEIFNKTIEIKTNIPFFFAAVLNKSNHYYCPECNKTDNRSFSISHSEGCINSGRITIF
jgi:hypothetical protein